MRFRRISAKLFGATDRPAYYLLSRQPCPGSLCGISHRRDLPQFQFFEDRLYRAGRVAEKLPTTDVCEYPTHPFQHGLPIHVFGKLFQRVIAIFVAFDRQPFAITLGARSIRKVPILQCGVITVDIWPRRYVS